MPETLHVRDQYNLRTPTVFFHSTEHLTDRGRMAAALVERWGMIQGTDGGEDSQGRAKVALMPVPEMIKRACDAAECFFNEVHSRGWVQLVPEWDEIEATARAQREEMDKEDERRHRR